MSHVFSPFFSDAGLKARSALRETEFKSLTLLSPVCFRDSVRPEVWGTRGAHPVGLSGLGPRSRAQLRLRLLCPDGPDTQPGLILLLLLQGPLLGAGCRRVPMTLEALRTRGPGFGSGRRPSMNLQYIEKPIGIDKLLHNYLISQSTSWPSRTQSLRSGLRRRAPMCTASYSAHGHIHTPIDTHTHTHINTHTHTHTYTHTHRHKHTRTHTQTHTHTHTHTQYAYTHVFVHAKHNQSSAKTD